MMKFILSLLLSIIFLVNTCKSEERGIGIERLKTDKPIKFFVGGVKKDSAKIMLYVPQEIVFKNNFQNKIQLSPAYVSKTGANIMAKNPLYQMRDSLYFPKTENYDSGEETSYLFYVGYIIAVHSSEVDSLKAKGRFAQFQYKRAVYDIGNLKESLHYLNRKIPDSVRGFMNLDCYNFETRLGFVESVPVEF